MYQYNLHKLEFSTSIWYTIYYRKFSSLEKETEKKNYKVLGNRTIIYSSGTYIVERI